MTEVLINAVSGNVLEIVITVISIIVSYYVIPCIKDDLVPWLKEKRIYELVKKFVEAVEKMAESGTIDKADKKNRVIKLLVEAGIEVTPAIEMAIEAAVKELDLDVQKIANAIKEEN